MAEESSAQTPDELLRQTQRRREALWQAMTDLEQAVTKPVSGRGPEWAATVAEAVDEVDDALRAHTDGTECADGLFDQVIEAQPRLAHHVARLRQDHVDMAAAVKDIQRELDGVAGNDEAAQAVRGHAVALVAKLMHHRHAGADLLYAAYSVDISSGD